MYIRKILQTTVLKTIIQGHLLPQPAHIRKEGSKITKAPVKDLTLPKDLTLGGLIRDGKGIIVNGNTQIQANDHVVVFCLDTAIRKIEKLFN